MESYKLLGIGIISLGTMVVLFGLGLSSLKPELLIYSLWFGIPIITLGAVVILEKKVNIFSSLNTGGIIVFVLIVLFVTPLCWLPWILQTFKK
ncbi:MAG: hypothetical protein M1391_11220 [Bacteroidetes bacterium]|nr:hypothetical protein [Bacteroidota bacterium]